jgi:NADP-dependent 3-hydroxy acid dehydrogenase YdfG
MASLKNKVAVVTGASSGIGKSIAHALARNGVDLCLLGRDKSKLEKVSSQLKKIHPQVQNYICEFASAENIHNIAETINRSFRDIDILVHSAGSIILRRLEEITQAEFDLQFSVNTRAPFLLTKLLLPAIKKRKGQIVFVNSSVAQQKARADLSIYAGSKYALRAIADSLRDEVNASEVRVLSVYPGRTATAMQEDIFKLENRGYRKNDLLQPEDVAQSVIDALALPRTAEITDIFIRPLKNI